MELNQTTLRGILAQILSVDEKYIVPKQANWWNAQEANANIENWCAYRIKSNRTRTLPFYIERDKAVATVEKIAEIELQFVGPQSEELAQSVAMWSIRGDVQEQFKKVHGSILNDEINAVSSIFMQDGNNGVLAWNVAFRILHFATMETTQNRIRTIDIGGQINVR